MRAFALTLVVTVALALTGPAGAADRLESAIGELIRDGKSVTFDMKPSRRDPTAVGTSDVADALIGKLQS
jgi:isocitrate dehydrogenase (NAD+)